jgi:hypothetical protein
VGNALVCSSTVQYIVVPTSLLVCLFRIVLPGKVYNCTFEDLTLDRAVMGVAISMVYASGEPAPPHSETTPHIEDLTYRRITGTAGNAGAFLCLPESQCRGLTLEDVNITSFLGGFECFRAQGSTSGVVVPDACF